MKWLEGYVITNNTVNWTILSGKLYTEVHWERTNQFVSCFAYCTSFHTHCKSTVSGGQMIWNLTFSWATNKRKTHLPRLFTILAYTECQWMVTTLQNLLLFTLISAIRLNVLILIFVAWMENNTKHELDNKCIFLPLLFLYIFFLPKYTTL